MIHGTTYALRQAKWLGLDTQETFDKVLDLKPDILRLGCYWSDIEKEKGKYDFTEIETLLKACEKSQQSVVLTIGMKAPRWPEFYLPSCMKGLSPENVEKEVLAFIEKGIKTLQEYSCITHWQVENEPFDPSGPLQWKISESLLKKEVVLTRSLDTRPIIVNVWGNLLTRRDSFKKVEKIADIVGINLYYKTPFLGPFYQGPRNNEWTLRRVIRSCSKPVWVTELQAEPWERAGKDFRSERPESISPTQMQKNIDAAKGLGVEGILLWGCEYWLFQKKRGNNTYEKVAKKFFSQSTTQD
jgi:hypothetical protein